jgi:arginase family enzyme
VEVNPVLDRENETEKLAVELVASALGSRILYEMELDLECG